MLQSMGSQNVGHSWVTEQQHDATSTGLSKALHTYLYIKPLSCPVSDCLHYLPLVTLEETQPNTGHHTFKHATLLLPYLFSVFPIHFMYLLFNASRFIKLNSCKQSFLNFLFIVYLIHTNPKVAELSQSYHTFPKSRQIIQVFYS